MSIGCLSCFKVMCFRKKQSKKEDKPVKAEILPEPVGAREDEENSGDKKTPINEVYMGPVYCPSYVGSNNSGFEQILGSIDYGKLNAGVSSSSLNNDFNKVKTFDLRGVTEAAAK